MLWVLIRSALVPNQAYLFYSEITLFQIFTRRETECHERSAEERKGPEEWKQDDRNGRLDWTKGKSM